MKRPYFPEGKLVTCSCGEPAEGVVTANHRGWSPRVKVGAEEHVCYHATASPKRRPPQQGDRRRLNQGRPPKYLPLVPLGKLSAAARHWLLEMGPSGRVEAALAALEEAARRVHEGADLESAR